MPETMLTPGAMTPFERGLIREIHLLRKESRDLKNKSLMQLKEIDELKVKAARIAELTARLRP